MDDIVRIDQNGRRSRAALHGQIVYVAGQVADDKTADIATQTRQALAKVDEMLGRVGSARNRLLTAQIWVRSMDDFDAMNAVWDAWVDPGEAPTRCCGEVKLADPDYLVEIVVTAALS
jgi:enamine deaminase RidA (YjgF/YER057c/UK114 family)